MPYRIEWQVVEDVKKDPSGRTERVRGPMHVEDFNIFELAIQRWHSLYMNVHPNILRLSPLADYPIGK